MSLQKKLLQIEAVRGQARTAASLGLNITGPAGSDGEDARRLRAIPAVGPNTSPHMPRGGQHDDGIGYWDEARQIHVLRTEHVTHPATTGCTHRSACSCNRRMAA